MNNVLQLNAHKVEQPDHAPAYRMEVNGIEPGHKLILWQDHLQRLVLKVDKNNRVIFRVEPLGYV